MKRAIPTIKQTIPVLSLNDYLHGTRSEQAKFVENLGSALSKIGFFALEDHGIDSELIEQSYGVAEEFFSQSSETKSKYILGNAGQRGFTDFGREHAKNSSTPDLKEFWHVGRDVRSLEKFGKSSLKNVWPTEVPQFKPSMESLYSKLDKCSLVLLDACSKFIGEEKNFLRGAAEGGNTVLRIIHYPPIEDDANPASIRAAAHEDINLITLLCESTAAGLELLQKDGSWLPIRSLKGQIIVDAGDMLQQLTNGLIKSTTHRVVNPDNSKERRFSMPFFVHPKSEFSLAARDNCVARTGGKKVFADITSAEYLHQRLREIGLI